MPDFARPQTLADALRIRGEGGWRVLAGGTDLYPGAGRSLAGPILDLSAVAGLSGLQPGPELRIGAATPWTVLAEADLPRGLAALQQAAREVGGRQVQNAGTLGGNLCNASPAADGVPPLLVVGAEVELASPLGLRRIGLDAFLVGPRRTALRTDEVLTAVVIPQHGLRGRSAFVKLGARTHLVISIAMVAARVEVEAGRIVAAAISVGSCSPVAVRLPVVEAALVGSRLADAAARIDARAVQAALSPIDDVRATADYRRSAAVELVRCAVTKALG